MIDERANDRLATDEDLLDFTREMGIKTINDIKRYEVRNNTFPLSLLPSQWEKYNNFLNLTENDWLECKYFDQTNHVNERNIKQIPNDKGGIYMYVVKPPLPIRYIPVIMYVGRAHSNGKKQNLRKRIREYLRESDDVYNGRTSIRTLFARYAKYLHVVYAPLDNNEEIDKLEKALISCIIPPLNRDLTQKSLREGRNAF